MSTRTRLCSLPCQKKNEREKDDSVWVVKKKNEREKDDSIWHVAQQITIAIGMSKKNEREKDDSIWDVKKKTNAKSSIEKRLQNKRTPNLR